MLLAWADHPCLPGGVIERPDLLPAEKAEHLTRRKELFDSLSGAIGPTKKPQHQKLLRVSTWPIGGVQLTGLGAI